MVRRYAPDAPALDAIDRTLLTILAQDAALSYADLGTRLHLSAPAVHERVRKLKRKGVILATVVRLDARKMGRALLAFVQVDAIGWGKDNLVGVLRALPEVEEIHSVTGETCMLLKVRTRDTQSLEDLLRRIYVIEGVKGTRSQVVLSTALERGPSPQAE